MKNLVRIQIQCDLISRVISHVIFTGKPAFFNREETLPKLYAKVGVAGHGAVEEDEVDVATETTLISLQINVPITVFRILISKYN